MALRFMDGFDHYATAQILDKWNVSTTQDGVGAGYQRNGTQGYRLRHNTVQPTLRKTLDNQDTWIVGVAWRTNSMGPKQILALIETATTQVDVRAKADGQIEVTRNGTLLGTTTMVSPMVTNQFYYIELKAVIHPSAGTIDLQVAGVNVLSLSGINTRATANSYANIVAFQATTNNQGNDDLDDIYILDGTGGAMDDFLGDAKVVTLYPSGAGNSTQFTPSAGSNYQCVDEATPNEDTDYVSSATPTQKDTYVFGDIAAAGTPFGVQVGIRTRKDDAGSRSIAPVVRHGGSDYDGTTVSALDAHKYTFQIYEDNPGTGIPWTRDDVNNAEFGVKLIA